MDFPAGHEVPNLTLPLGTEVELVVDQVTGWLTYKEDALSSAEPDPSVELQNELPLTTETVAP
jgi:hypothetical protein